MTPKEKAIEFVFELADMFDPLIVRYDSGEPKGVYPDIKKAKKCALVCVEEMLNNAGFIWGGRDTEMGISARDKFRTYWQSVKEEINKL